MERAIWIARHGHREDSDPNWKQTAQNPYDPDLSEQGIVQARKLADRISSENIQHIFVSPYLRTMRTAYYCAFRTNLKIKVEEGLGEFLNPEWFSTKPFLDSIERRSKRFPLIDTDYQSIVVPEYPESDDDLDVRCRRTICEILKGFAGNTLLIGHGASCLSIVRNLNNWPVHTNMPLCSLSKLLGNGEKWELIMHADTAHLAVS